ncbi:sugar ABC transporter ATP-binding protein [Nakamurella silvestris]|nr:sugar ABC transporter ATP-binding protein [Nakamurella silvestris]
MNALTHPTGPDSTPGAPITPLVLAEGITKRFGPTVALNDVRISIQAGRTHALVGRNGAGKSTLVSILTGLEAPNEGQVYFNGEAAPPLTDSDAWRARVACVYQKSTIVPGLSVAENLFINRQGLGRRVINWKSLRRQAALILDEWEVPVDVNMAAEDLTVEQRQLVEIARSLSYGARFIILDEPTAQLDGMAIKRLFRRIRDLQAQGVTFLFISHHLAETYEICQDITVYRDAKWVTTAPVEDLGHAALVEAMTGESVAHTEVSSRPAATGPAVLEIAGLGVEGQFQDVTLAVRPGEIVGLAGGGASGKAEVAETIVGLRKAETGTVAVAGATPAPGSVRDALKAGIGFVPRDRHEEGLIPEMSVADNATLSVPERLGPYGLLSRSRRDRMARQAIVDLDIKTFGPDQSVEGLSGGNQQKVVMARALASDPRVLVLITPTAGVDVRSKQTLMDAVRKVGDDGAGVLVVSDELDDLRDCDRILVMFQGAITQEFSRGWGDTELVAAMEGLSK